MSEIKFDLTLTKIKFSVSFMPLFTVTEFLSTLQLARQDTNLFSSHFTSLWSCSVCLVLGENAGLHLENETK